MNGPLRLVPMLTGLAMTLPIAGPMPVRAEPAVSPQQAYEIGLEAYLYFYPLVLMDITRSQMTNVPPGGFLRTRPMNALLHVRGFPTPDSKTVVRPNFDTLYSLTWLDVSKEPVIVTVPAAAERYYLLPLMDMWTDVFAVIAERTTGSGHFAVALPGWQGSLPQGVGRIDAPTPYVWIIGRIQTNGAGDYPIVHKIQDGYRVTPLSEWGRDPQPPSGSFSPGVDMRTPAPRQVSAMPAERFFAYAAELMKLHPPHAIDQPILARMRRIGIEPGKSSDPPDPAIRQALDRAAADGPKLMQAQRGAFGRRVNGWRISTDFIGVYGSAYLRRAVVAADGLGANLPEDAVYPSTSIDSDNQPLDGANRYVIRFKPGELPPVDAFWSITLYDPDGYPARNPLERYALGDRDPIRYEPDGSLEILVQARPPVPERQTNWLPAPAGPFNLTMRLYAPRRPVLEGRWAPPAVERLP
jgi:hypothetical protein